MSTNAQVDRRNSPNSRLDQQVGNFAARISRGFLTERERENLPHRSYWMRSKLHTNNEFQDTYLLADDVLAGRGLGGWR